jgi:hypothetical protein
VLAAGLDAVVRAPSSRLTVAEHMQLAAVAEEAEFVVVGIAVPLVQVFVVYVV